MTEGDAAPAALVVDLPTAAGPVCVRVWPATTAADGAPLLLALHGWTDSGAVFGPIAHALGRRWTVVAPDAPAHGRTPWSPAPTYSVPDHVEHATAVLDALPQVAGRRGQVVVMGHSMGALTAARLAARRREVVSRIVLEDPARTTARKVPSRAAMRRRLLGLQRLDDEGRLALLAEQNPDWPADEGPPWAYSKAQVDARHVDATLDWGPPLADVLRETVAPVTLVRGDAARGGIVSAAAAARCAAACPGGCDVVALPTGHNPRREARRAFAAVLENALGAPSPS